MTPRARAIECAHHAAKHTGHLHYAFLTADGWGYSAGQHRGLRDASAGYVVAYPSGVVVEIAPLP